MKYILTFFARNLFYLLYLLFGCSACQPPKEASDVPLQDKTTITRVWDAALHNAFTDLIRFNNHWYISHREGTGHVPQKDNTGDGTTRIIRSSDGETWTSVALLEKADWDLRDPKMSITPKGELMVIMGASDYDGRDMQRRMPHVSFSADGKNFSQPSPVRVDSTLASDWNWIWRITWYRDTGYGINYQVEPGSDQSIAWLIKTSNGINYEAVTQLNLEGLPNEATIRFDNNGGMYMIIRRERDDQEGYIGYSTSPYTEWHWNSLGFRLGGPNFILLPDQSMIMGTRVYPEEGYQTALFEVDTSGYIQALLTFPSGGDNSYPGMVWYNDTLWFSYYSSHEEKTAIYLAKMAWEE